jgi:hypothetical protein
MKKRTILKWLARAACVLAVMALLYVLTAPPIIWVHYLYYPKYLCKGGESNDCRIPSFYNPLMGLDFRFFRDVLVKKHWLKRRFWARLFAGARRVRYAWRPAGPRTGVRESVPAARRPLRMGRRELGSGRDWLGAFKVWG